MNYKFLSIAIVLTIFAMGMAIMPKSVSHFIPFRISLISNLAHIPLFAGITFVWLLTISRFKPRQNKNNRALIFMVVIGIAILAGFSEAIQEFISGRSSSLYDFLLDVVGISIGTCGAILWEKRASLSGDDILD
jgi:VanZ family protein